jgi:hypothetical protein
MIRRSTLLWLVAAILIGCGLYQLKYEVQAKEEQLARLNRQIQAEQEAIHVLHAEWAFLNRPDRLGDLAARHLEMNAVTPTQFGRVGAIPQRALTAVAAVESEKPVQAPAAPAAAAPVKVVAKPAPAPKPPVYEAKRAPTTLDAQLRAAKRVDRDVVVIVDGALLVNVQR